MTSLENGNDVVIDFAKLGGPVYLGRERGQKIREQFALDRIDKIDQKVVVNIPANTYSINSSFFLGLFGRSIRNAGSREEFLQKFTFDAPRLFSEVIESCIARALHEKGFLIGK